MRSKHKDPGTHRCRVVTDLKLIYHDIPKTASTSIKTALGIKGSPEIGIRQGRRWEDITEEEKSYFSFTFVRHPVDRVLSQLSMMANWEEIGVKSDTKDSTQQLSDFIENERLIISQCDYLPPINQINFIGRFDRLLEDWAVLQEQFNLNDLPMKNRSKDLKNTKTAIDLSHEQLKFLEATFADDMNAFGFESYNEK